ncbi:MAG: thiamine phosphate synthase [Gemmatales bacterium]|nr:thiamine phosphate synthase [Gemmatales bacterium]MDW7993191.1 thiamine phosphate synthase [Gemmatales bacterium]
MLPEVTPAVLRALAQAHWLAEHLAEPPRPAHLLCALCLEPEGRVATILAEFGISRDELCLQLLEQKVLPVFPPTPLVEDTDLPRLIQGFFRVLRAAKRLAREHTGESTVASEYVLVALAQADEHCRGCLERLGLPLERLQTRVQPEATTLSLDEPLQMTPSPESYSLARIVDANFNRAREACRVVEDYCRFVLNDPGLHRDWRLLRHELSELVSQSNLPLTVARDTPGDVGTAAGEEVARRYSFAHLVRVNCSRLQEALRTIEEALRLHDADLAARLAPLRYRCYTLEKATLILQASQEALAHCRLCVIITGALCAQPLETTVKEVLAGGADMIQLREKNLPDRELLRRAEQLRRWTSEARALFTVNDRPDVAVLVQADGVHLGQTDLPISQVRRLVGAQKLIGLSTHNLEQLRHAVESGANYVGVGPVFPTTTKSISELAGLEYVRQAAKETTLPAFAIGGITSANVAQVVEAGLRRIAVSSVVCRSENPRAVVRELRRFLEGASGS